jgi:hypothetical protein
MAIKFSLVTGSLWCAVSLLSFGSAALAAPAIAPTGSMKACSELLRECMTAQDEGRATCLQNSASDERCAGTELAKLAFMRGTASVSNPGDDSLALLGPQFIDKECISGFDNQLSADLIRGVLTKDETNGLIERLESCRRDGAEDVFRP